MRTVGHHLDALSTATSDLAQEVDKLVAALTEEQLLWRPRRGEWGVADCLEHLVATGEVYHPRIRTQLLAAWHDPYMEDEPYEPTWFGRRFIREHGPNGRPLKARGPLVPARATVDTPARFAARQIELLELISDAREVDLRRVRIKSPQSRWRPLPLGEALEMLVVHQRRHVAQARRVAETTGFPSRSGSTFAARSQSGLAHPSPRTPQAA